ncbi:hypothetical protein LSTR_LSTR006895 [Laodelphax striatellus]|uniref:Cuticle protein n=1 Tax=Laodelphax striatellus TaxID=195883 RepID=A0A482WKE4_LAOST|nr:hypothetical protein LSTR_LSTR006895 [Laodelphax striatellus]
MDVSLKIALCVIAVVACIQAASSQEVGVPERYLRPRNFNPHPYEATPLQDYGGGPPLELEDTPQPHPTLLHHPYPLFHRVDTRNDDNRPVQFPSVPAVVKKTFKNKASKYVNVPKNYAFSYAVKDQHSGDDFSHSQAHDGKATQGQYRVKLPDGRTQVVSYTADNKGYRADVTYEGDKIVSKEETAYSQEQLSPHPHEIPGYISTLVHKKIGYNRSPKTSPTSPTLLVYDPESGYKTAAAGLYHKYKAAPPIKISPSVSSDGKLGYQSPTAPPAYYTTYNDVYAQPTPVIPVAQKYVKADDIIQSITAKYLSEAYQHYPSTTSAPSLGDYASVRSTTPAPIYEHQPDHPSTPSPQDYDYSLRSPTPSPSPPPSSYQTSSERDVDLQQHTYYALSSQDKLISPDIKYILVPSDQYASYKQRR